MADVTLAGNTTGSAIVLAADEVFSVTEGRIDFSSDGGTTYIAWNAGEKVVFANGVTVDQRNSLPRSSSFSHMVI